MLWFQPLLQGGAQQQASGTAYTLGADPFTLAITAQSADLQLNRSLGATATSYALTPQTANGVYAQIGIASPTSYALSFSSANLTYAQPGVLGALPFALSATFADAKLIGPGATGFPGFEVDIEPSIWWKRKPKKEPEEQAKAKLVKVAKAIKAKAEEHVEINASRAYRKDDVRRAIEPFIAEMPGFDWVAMYDVTFNTLINLAIKRQMDEAEAIATAEIARIKAIADEEDEIALLLSVM